jgi:hypothetical protein
MKDEFLHVARAELGEREKSAAVTPKERAL